MPPAQQASQTPFIVSIVKYILFKGKSLLAQFQVKSEQLFFEFWDLIKFVLCHHCHSGYTFFILYMKAYVSYA